MLYLQVGTQIELTVNKYWQSLFYEIISFEKYRKFTINYKQIN